MNLQASCLFFASYVASKTLLIMCCPKYYITLWLCEHVAPSTLSYVCLRPYHYAIMDICHVVILFTCCHSLYPHCCGLIAYYLCEQSFFIICHVTHYTLWDHASGYLVYISSWCAKMFYKLIIHFVTPQFTQGLRGNFFTLYFCIMLQLAYHLVDEQI